MSLWRLELLIGAAVGSTSLKWSTSGTELTIATFKGSDDGIYMLRFDEIRDEWALIMFVSARAQAMAARAT
jgi:hypothetical protein